MPNKDKPSPKESINELQESGTRNRFSASVNELSNLYVKFLRLLSCNWSSHGAAKLLCKDLIKYIRPRIHRCSTPLKVRILISFLYISDELRKECKIDLIYLLSNCEMDRDDWVRKISRLLLPYVDSGHIDIRGIDTETVYRTIESLDEYQSKAGQPFRIKPPLEFTKVFDITTDYFEDYRAADQAAREQLYPSSNKETNEVNKTEDVSFLYDNELYNLDLLEDNQVKYENIDFQQPSPSTQKEPLFFATLPAYELETEAFQADPRFASLMSEIEAQGIADIEKDLRQHKHYFSKGNQ